MNNNNVVERKRLMLLLQQGMNIETISIIPPRPNPSVSQATIDKNMAKAYPDLGRHDWGPFGEYEFLGPGTRYSAKERAGIEGINDLDRIAKMHDAGYQHSSDVRSGAHRALERAYHDAGAGSAMILAGLNPWSDAPLILSVAAGVSLIAQAGLRIHPVTFLPMGVFDAIFY